MVWCPVAQKVGLEQAAHLDEEGLQRFADSPAGQGAARAARPTSKAFPPSSCRPAVTAEMRPYQKDGFDFLCHLTSIRLGGILADDMGLGKTLQTLAWLAWLQGPQPERPEAVAGDLPGLRAAQLAARGRAVHART